MSRITLGQITLHRDKAISMTKKYYLLQPSSAAAPNPYGSLSPYEPYGITPPTYTQIGYSGWSNTEPSYEVGDDRVLYELSEVIYSDNTWDYSTPTISSSYEAAKDAYNEAIQAGQTIAEFEELGLKKGYIWDNATYVAPSGSIPVYPVGSYIASGTLVNGTRSITHANSNTYGLNTWISTGGINLRYNAIDLMKLTTSNLFFYYPSTSTQQKKAISLGTNGAVNSLVFYGFNNDNKTMELTNEALTFYDPTDGQTERAVLNTNGLVLKKGGIKVIPLNGAIGDNNSVYISSDNLGSAVPSLVPTPSGGTPKTNWRAVIGSKFGVDSEGNLYANNAYITGEIKADTGRIGGTSGWTIASQQIYSTDETIGTDNSMFLSTKDLAGTVAGTTLTTTEGPSWRLTVGSNFGVDNTGKLYATGVKISGDLTADSLSTGGRTSSTAAAGTYIDANGAIYGGNNKFTVTKEGALTAEGAVLNNLYFKDQYKTYGFLGWTTSESSGLIGSYEITSDWYEEHASDSTLVLTYAYTNSFSSPFILKKNGDIIPTSTNYYQISTSISINTVTVTINLTTVGVDDGDEFSVYATNKNNTHYYIALNGYDDSYKYGQGSFSCGESCEASGIFSTAIGRSVKVTGIGSFGQGREHKVTGPYCNATGVNNTVNTYFSHAEGGYNLIDEEANVAHAEGWHTTITADGNGAHTEGGYTTATAQSAHAEGDYTLASGAESHAGGYYTIAQGMCQTVIGAFNEAIGTPNSVPDRTVPVFIIGNGTRKDSRSNALTVDWAGNVKASGDITANNIGVMLYRLPAATSCTSGRWFQVAYLTLTPGVWLIDCNALFPATSATGTRQIRVTTATSGYDNVTTAPQSYGNIARDILAGADTTQYPQAHFPVKISDETTFRLIAYQGSGSTMSVTGRMYATRLK